MKKLIIVLALGTIVVSCKKEYTCHCDLYTNNGQVFSNESIVKGTKEEATELCESNSFNTSGGNSKNCYLK